MVEKLFEDFRALPEVEAIALGGSRAGNRFDSASDYDVYLYCTGPVAETVRRDILSRYCSILEIGNRFWECEDNCRLKNGVDLDLLYRDLDDFVAGVAAVAEQFQAKNGYTTCMWHNLRTCRVIYDRDGRLAAAKRRFDIPYPRQLKEAVIDRNWKLLHAALPCYETQIRKAAKRRDLVSVSHRTAAFLESYFDILFALNERTHPGEKRLAALCREQCGVLPRRFEENLEALFQDMFDDSGRLMADIREIIDELGKILPSPPPRGEGEQGGRP